MRGEQEALTLPFPSAALPNSFAELHKKLGEGK
jgi:hypothetical protein